MLALKNAPTHPFARDLHFISYVLFSNWRALFTNRFRHRRTGKKNFRIVGLKPLSVPYQVVKCDRRFLMCRADDGYPLYKYAHTLNLLNLKGSIRYRLFAIRPLHMRRSFALERLCVAVPLLRVAAHLIRATARLMACRQLRYIRVSSFRAFVITQSHLLCALQVHA